MDIGGNINDFWDYSIKEVADIIQSYNRKKDREEQAEIDRIKLAVTLNTVLSIQIGEEIACLFDGKTKKTDVKKFFPELFQKEIKEQEERERELYLIRRKEFVENHNKKMKGV